MRALVRLGDEAVTLLKPLSFVNLTGPVVVNRATRRGAQLISVDPQHCVKHAILEEMRLLGEPREKTASC